MDKKYILKELGKNIKAERNRAGLSQDGLAAKIGVCAGKHIGKIERGEINTSAYTLIMIMKVLNISFEKLFDINKQ